MRVYRPPLRKPRIEMIPLIDSFFLLLAFFMSSVLTMEVVQGLPVELPRVGRAAPLPSEDRRVVTISPEGAIQWEGQGVTLEELGSRLAILADRTTLRLGIRADRAAPYERVVEVLAVCRQAGISRATLLTSPVEEKAS